MSLHVPPFNSMTDMMGFLRALPQNADYQAMLEKSFGVSEIPADAEPYQKEYFFKYLVQGQYLGLEGDDLFGYAFRKVNDHDKKFPWFTRPAAEPVATPVTAKVAKKPVVRNSVKRNTIDKSDGVRFLAHRGVWIGCVGGKCVVTKKTEDGCKEVLRNKHGIAI